jgi:hypothetical protein
VENAGGNYNTVGLLNLAKHTGFRIFPSASQFNGNGGMDMVHA